MRFSLFLFSGRILSARNQGCDPVKSPYFYLNSVRGVILDWDGIIAETKLDFSTIRQKYFAGRRVPLLEAADKMASPQREEFLDAIKDEEMRGAKISVPVPGTSELIDYLDVHGVPWCIVSRNCRESIDLAANVTDFKLPEHVFSREAQHVKPDPAAMTDAADAMGVPVTKCLAVGDYLYELLAARRSGMRCVLVRGTDAECLALADGYFSTMSNLARAFKDGKFLVPWEYHSATEKYGEAALKIFARQTVHIDCPLNPSTIALLKNLASLGVGTFSISSDRQITINEFQACPFLPSKSLYMNAGYFLKPIFLSRWPFLSLCEGNDGILLSSISSAEYFARTVLDGPTPKIKSL